MEPARADFEALLYERLVQEFCSDPKRRLMPASFRRESLKLSEYDAKQFMRAWSSGMLQHDGRGIYRCSLNGLREQFFWSGPKNRTPRQFTLWIEPIITVGAFARLYFEFGWPIELIGNQSADWAFDLVAYSPGTNQEYIAGEVKKTKREADVLIDLMQQFGHDPSAIEPPSGKTRNAFKKVVALRKRKAPKLWVIGPNRYSKVFDVAYSGNNRIDLYKVNENVLRFVEP